MFIKILVTLFIFTASLLLGQDAFYYRYVPFSKESVFYYLSQENLETTLSDTMQREEAFVNWTELNYFSSFIKISYLDSSDNFVTQPWGTAEQEGRRIRSLVYKDMLSLVVNDQLTLKRLIFLSPDFRSNFLKVLYDPGFVQNINIYYSKLRFYVFFPMTGSDGLIDLFIKSRYYSEPIELKAIESPYIPNSYSELIIDARGLGLNPAIFPNIYTYDKEGNLILVYSFNSADKKAIINNGYVHYIKTEKRTLNSPKSFYTMALGVNGEEKTDIIISTENYLKFFSSAEAIKNLKEGKFYIVIDEEKK